jgi:hypothetical protein
MTLRGRLGTWDGCAAVRPPLAHVGPDETRRLRYTQGWYRRQQAPVHARSIGEDVF